MDWRGRKVDLGPAREQLAWPSFAAANMPVDTLTPFYFAPSVFERTRELLMESTEQSIGRPKRTESQAEREQAK
jgi:hypothetical protein